MQKRTAALIAGLSGLVLTCGLAAQQPRGASGAATLDYFIGTWNYSIKGSDASAGVWKVTKGAAGVLHIDETNRPPSGSPVEIAAIMAYDGTRKEFVWQRAWSTGQTDRARGWANGDKLTFVFDDVSEGGQPARLQTTLSMGRPGQFTFRWERSIAGGPWEITGEGTSTRVP